MKKMLTPSLFLCLLFTGASLKAQNADAQVSPAPSYPDVQTPSGAAAPNSAPAKAATVPAPAPPIPAPGDPLFAPVAATPNETLHEKFMDYMTVTVGPRALFSPAFSAALRMANPPKTYPRDWKDGGQAFGRNYGDNLARSASLQTGRFLTGAVLHEDFRYRPSTSKNPVARTFHAVEFAFFDKSDSGHTRPAFANFVGAASDGFVGNLYLPAVTTI